jgi:hypothetical protein
VISKRFFSNLRVATGIFLAISAFFAASAQACEYPAGEQVFPNDPRAYVLAPDGDFSAGGAGWSLQGGAAVAGGALSLPGGSSAESPAICVSMETPFLRAMVRNGGDPAARLRVEIVYTGLGMAKSSVIAGVGEEWSPTQPLSSTLGLAAVAGESAGPVHVRITPLDDRGEWQVDDFYVDPFARH